MTASAPLIEYISVLKDPRIGPAKRHNFFDVIAIAVCAIICGADSWVDREDDSRVRVANAAENFSTLRRTTLNMLKQERSISVGIAAKRKRARWDMQYLLKALAQ